jgi:hypothetical protein
MGKKNKKKNKGGGGQGRPQSPTDLGNNINPDDGSQASASSPSPGAEIQAPVGLDLSMAPPTNAGPGSIAETAGQANAVIFEQNTKPDDEESQDAEHVEAPDEILVKSTDSEPDEEFVDAAEEMRLEQDPEASPGETSMAKTFEGSNEAVESDGYPDHEVKNVDEENGTSQTHKEPHLTLEVDAEQQQLEENKRKEELRLAQEKKSEDARRKAEKRKTDDLARLQAVKEASLRAEAEEAARLKAEDEARKAEAEAFFKAEDEARRKVATESQLVMEEEMRIKEDEARQKASRRLVNAPPRADGATPKTSRARAVDVVRTKLSLTV